METKALVPIYGIIYKCTNLVNGKVYIGQTKCSLASRIKKHYRNVDKHMNRYFYDAINHYGKSSFTWTVIDSAVSKKVLDEKESYWILVYCSNLKTFGYNMTFGGEGGDTYHGLSKERQQECSLKISNALKGKKKPENFGEKISKAIQGKNNPNYGKPMNPIAREKLRLFAISDRNPAKRRTKETCKKISEANKGKVPPNFIPANKLQYLKELDFLLKGRILKADFNVDNTVYRIYIVIDRQTKHYNIYFNSHIKQVSISRLYQYKLSTFDRYIIVVYNYRFKCIETEEILDRLSIVKLKYGLNRINNKDKRGFSWVKFLEVDEHFNTPTSKKFLETV